jgi:glutamate racemase
MDRTQSIGIFDSGFGGLTVLRGIVRLLPGYDYIYLADTARAPYGSLSSKTIYRYTKQAVDFLFKKNCALIILACNTASSQALRRLQQEYLPKRWPGKRVLGVLVPAAEEAVKLAGQNPIGVIATLRTVRSGAFAREIKKSGGQRLYGRACPRLVPLIESGEYDSPRTDKLISAYLKPLLDKKISALILGCTHYDILRGKIRKITGPVKIVSEHDCVPPKLRDYLKRHPEIEVRLKKKPAVSFYTTGDKHAFNRLSDHFYGQTVKAKRVALK